MENIDGDFIRDNAGGAPDWSTSRDLEYEWPAPGLEVPPLEDPPVNRIT